MRSVVTLLHALHERGNKLRSNATEGLVITLLTRRRSLSWIFYDGVRLLTLTKYLRPYHKGICNLSLCPSSIFFSRKKTTYEKSLKNPQRFFFYYMNKLMEDTGLRSIINSASKTNREQEIYYIMFIFQLKMIINITTCMQSNLWPRYIPSIMTRRGLVLFFSSYHISLSKVIISISLQRKFYEITCIKV